MSKLTFKHNDLVRVLTHTLNSKTFAHSWDYSVAPPVQKPMGMHLLLVKDEGIYLMSGGAERDLVDTPVGQRSYCAYATGYNPMTGDHDDVWDKASRVSGDDFVERVIISPDDIDWIMKKRADIIITLTATQMRVAFREGEDPFKEKGVAKGDDQRKAS